MLMILSLLALAAADGPLPPAPSLSMPDVLFGALLGLVPFALVGAVSVLRSFAANERAKYRATPSTADDGPGEARAQAWDAAADAVMQLRGIVEKFEPASPMQSSVESVSRAVFAAHRTVEGRPHFADPHVARAAPPDAPKPKRRR